MKHNIVVDIYDNDSVIKVLQDMQKIILNHDENDHECTFVFGEEEDGEFIPLDTDVENVFPKSIMTTELAFFLTISEKPELHSHILSLTHTIMVKNAQRGKWHHVIWQDDQCQASENALACLCWHDKRYIKNFIEYICQADMDHETFQGPIINDIIKKWGFCLETLDLVVARVTKGSGQHGGEQLDDFADLGLIDYLKKDQNFEILLAMLTQYKGEKDDQEYVLEGLHYFFDKQKESEFAKKIDDILNNEYDTEFFVRSKKKSYQNRGLKLYKDGSGRISEFNTKHIRDFDLSVLKDVACAEKVFFTGKSIRSAQLREILHNLDLSATKEIFIRYPDFIIYDLYFLKDFSFDGTISISSDLIRTKEDETALAKHLSNHDFLISGQKVLNDCRYEYIRDYIKFCTNLINVNQLCHDKEMVDIDMIDEHFQKIKHLYSTNIKFPHDLSSFLEDFNKQKSTNLFELLNKEEVNELIESLLDTDLRVQFQNLCLEAYSCFILKRTIGSNIFCEMNKSIDITVEKKEKTTTISNPSPTIAKSMVAGEFYDKLPRQIKSRIPRISYIEHGIKALYSVFESKIDEQDYPSALALHFRVGDLIFEDANYTKSIIDDLKSFSDCIRENYLFVPPSYSDKSSSTSV